MEQPQEGEGLILRDPNINPPQVRKLLLQIGSEIVTDIILVRTPLSKSTQFLLNIASFGQLQSAMQEAKIDKLFHLSMLINGKYQLEKNEVIKMVKNSNVISLNSETLKVPINTPTSINQMLENTQKRMGSSYGSYDAVSNNCSVFLSNILSSNNLNNENTDTFLNQSTQELFSLFPSLSKYLVKLGTDTGAVVDRQIQGEGTLEYFYNFGYPRCKIIF